MLLTEYRTFKVDKRLVEASIKENKSLVVKGVIQRAEATLKENRPLTVKGVIQRAEAKNQNGRIYPKEILEREINKYIAGPVKEKRALGELDHPESSVINLQNVSHNVTKVKMVGDDVYGEVEILSTPAGNILKELFRNGITVGISSRGMGSVQESSNGTVEVQDDFELLCFDFVSTPSTHGAFMSPMGRTLQEGKIQVPEYKYTNVNNIIRDIICDNTGMCKC